MPPPICLKPNIDKLNMIIKLIIGVNFFTNHFGLVPIDNFGLLFFIVIKVLGAHTVRNLIFYLYYISSKPTEKKSILTFLFAPFLITQKVMRECCMLLPNTIHRIMNNLFVANTAEI